MSKTKRQLSLFSLYDGTGVARHLEKMAAEGWMLRRIGRTFWQYEEIEPKKLHFSATFLEKASSFDPEYSEERDTFHAFCERTDWTFVASWERMQIFCNEQEAPVPLDTDPETQLRVIHRAMRATNITYCVLLLLSLFLAYGFVGRLITDPIGLLADALGFFTGSCFLLLLILSLGELINYFLWRRKAKRAAAQGNFFPTKGLDRISAVCLIILGLDVVFYALSFRTGYMGAIMVLYPLILLFAVHLGERVKRHLKRHGASPAGNRTATALSAGITAAILTAILIPILVGSAKSHPDPSIVLLNDPPMDFSALVEEDSSYIRNIDYNHSFLFTEYTMTLRSGNLAETPHKLEFTVTRSNLPLLDNWCKEQLLDRYAPWRLRELQGAFRETDAAPWGANEVWEFLDQTGIPQNRYLLRYEDHMVELVPDWILTHEQRAAIGAMLQTA